MKIKNITPIQIFFFILLIVLVESILCQPQIDIVIKRQVADFYPFKFCKLNLFSKFWQENGLVENIQSFFLLIAIIILLKVRKFYQNENKYINAFLIIHIIGLIYYFGEEISWGQHFFNWNSPEFFINFNNQNETNIHNISNIFDQLPRTLVLVWCGLSVPFILIYNKFFDLKKKIFSLICPNHKLLIVSLTLLFFVLPDLIIDKFDLHPGASGIIDPFLYSAYFYDLISFNFFRLSELHELIFSFYFFFYAYLINKSLKILN